MKISKMRKVFPFYEQHGNLVYIGGVQRKLRPDEENLLFRVLLSRKLNRLGKQLGEAAKAMSLAGIGNRRQSDTEQSN
ncbi:hypothetical protein MN210_03280 [Psychrobacter raelei]|uniref:Uncharacterized protein n=1 Tax=Psychrobacter raelei TaxID=2565531 RepID=A0AAT9PFF6_9GAMM|nr:hypothetical protein [Psychrobacter sp. PraFG1]UNK05821.1 hypothetical protein MN210_03280 [Psychrobacter sp. PraFG1]